jgi:hypothetical protein
VVERQPLIAAPARVGSRSAGRLLELQGDCAEKDRRLMQELRRLE